jgi:hypothetical protein
MPIEDFDPVYLPDDGFPRERPADVRRALEDGTYEIISVEIAKEES